MSSSRKLQNVKQSPKRRPETLPPKNAPSAKTPPEADRPNAVNDQASVSEAAAADDAEPYWVPYGMKLNRWPPELRAELATIINPAYRELVLLAKPGLAKSTGITIVFFLWLEILDQLELSGIHIDSDSQTELRRLLRFPSGWESRRMEIIDRLLRVVHGKRKVSEFLLRLQEFNNRCRSTSQLDGKNK